MEQAAVIMATWNRFGLEARRLFNREIGACFYAPPIKSATAFDPSAPVEITQNICFRVVRRSGMRVIEGDGLMVEAFC